MLQVEKEASVDEIKAAAERERKRKRAKMRATGVSFAANQPAEKPEASGRHCGAGLRAGMQLADPRRLQGRRRCALAGQGSSKRKAGAMWVELSAPVRLKKREARQQLCGALWEVRPAHRSASARLHSRNAFARAGV